MKPKAIFVGILLVIIFLFISCAHQDDFPVFKGAYLGQKSPGMKPEVFKSEEFPLQFVVTPDIGHWIPEDIEVKIDQAIYHIRQRQAFRSQCGGKQT